MIASLRGIVQFKYSDRIIVDVHGVGYEVSMPESALFSVPDEGHEVFLYIHSHIREDAFLLFGFFERQDKQTFQLLLTVSGVGPKLALAILSGISPPELSRAVSSEDIGRLTHVAGVGKKTAERLCLELKDKVAFIPLSEAVHPGKSRGGSRAEDSVMDDAVSALVNLGYPPANAKEAVAAIYALREGDVTLENLIRLALRSLAS
ncbi:MAG: Holliday junction branch migration protein RuvA [Proteobacteria bacterium]|nr:Holliday junction branch migration protein RuvA [Pseudomonadota bacterium]MBU1639973.1 Holliday junction branch migration protein RuvA [Pseudomonadota bacterium]